MNRPLKYLILILITGWQIAFAQDPQFTQFYANPIYLNPAYTGVTYEHRFIGNYRNQWMGIAKAYQTFSVSYDYNMASLNSGIGFQLWRDQAGSSKFTTTNLGASYAYRVKISKFEEVRGGLQVNYVNQAINYSKLLFNDQLTSTPAAVSADAVSLKPNKNYININAGILLNSTKYWAGFSAKHVNAPNTGFGSTVVKLPVDFSLHGGFRIVTEKKGSKLLKYIGPAFNYRHQHNYDQLDIGVYYVNFPLNLGVWYRGLPLKHYSRGFPNNDALTFLVGVDIEKYDLRIAYSYDFILQKLITNSTGSHEISVIYEIAKRKSKNKKVLISCPKF